MTLVVLAAGIGSRFGGIKQMTPVGPAGQFLLDYSCHDAVRAGFDRIVFIIRREHYDDFRETVGKRVEPHVKVEYVFQELTDLPQGYSLPEGRTKPWGTAHALLACRGLVRDCFVTVNADDFYGYDAFRIAAERMREVDELRYPADCCLVGYRLGNTLSDSGTVSRGVCEVAGDGRLKSIHEYKKVMKTATGAAGDGEDGNPVPLSVDDVVSMNMFGLTPAVLDYMYNVFPEFLTQMTNPMKDEFLIPTVVSRMMQEGCCTVSVEPTAERWFGMTYTADLPGVREALRLLTESGKYSKELW